MLVNPYDDFWYQNWLTSVDNVIKEDDFELILNMLASDEMYSFTEKTLAEHATNDFAFTVVQASELNLLQALHRGGFNLSACKLSDGQNLLMTAANDNSSSEILDFLINNKINDVNDKNNDGRTALMYLAKSDAFNPKNFELLIRAGANVNAINNGGQTALIMATRSRYATDKIRFLLDLGANVSLKDSSNRAAIYYTSKDYNTDCLRLLGQHGADINQRYTCARGGHCFTKLPIANIGIIHLIGGRCLIWVQMSMQRIIPVPLLSNMRWIIRGHLPPNWVCLVPLLEKEQRSLTAQKKSCVVVG